MMDKAAFDKENVFRQGQPSDAFTQYSDGQSSLDPLVGTDSSLFLADVTSEPGCRNHWHAHNTDRGGGQTLICTTDQGRYQGEGKEAVSPEPEKAIMIPANAKYWHGAKKDSWFSHASVEVPGENIPNTWLEVASDNDYNAL